MDSGISIAAQNSHEGVHKFPCWLDISRIHIATQFKGASQRIGLHSFYKFVEIVVDITFAVLWVSQYSGLEPP